MVVKTQNYSEAYKDDLFLLWFRNQQPFAKKLWEMIPEDWGDTKPAAATLSDWIRESFMPKAETLNVRLAQEIEGRLVKEKVEMLYRHAEVGRKMQRIALERLDSIPEDDLNANASVRLLVEGIKIERDSVGLPQALEKLLDKDDAELLNRVESLIGDAPGEILDG
jgi:hypothetical protein